MSRRAADPAKQPLPSWGAYSFTLCGYAILTTLEASAALSDGAARSVRRPLALRRRRRVDPSKPPSRRAYPPPCRRKGTRSSRRAPSSSCRAIGRRLRRQTSSSPSPCTREKREAEDKGNREGERCLSRVMNSKQFSSPIYDSNGACQIFPLAYI
ncbi:hypothetical protein PAHAL_6G186300 [Panicum hallii]|uniref:Uncharacterized protein n=1 Tax=Panicum hallii TaxID=206008 RepID=A0A2S3I2C5_9POAL|nr:hypothetical protein PAHAL_6G186300 [Panicum hallii]